MDGFQQFQTRFDSPLRVVFVGLGEAKVDHKVVSFAFHVVAFVPLEDLVGQFRKGRPDAGRIFVTQHSAIDSVQVQPAIQNRYLPALSDLEEAGLIRLRYLDRRWCRCSFGWFGALW